jgi:hypothetical protein
MNLLMVWINNEIGCYRFRKFGFFAGKFVTNNFPSSILPQIKLFPVPFTKLKRSLSFRRTFLNIENQRNAFIEFIKLCSVGR